MSIRPGDISGPKFGLADAAESELVEKWIWKRNFIPVVIHTDGCSIPQEGEVILVASCKEDGVNTGHCSAIAEFDAAVC